MATLSTYLKRTGNDYTAYKRTQQGYKWKPFVKIPGLAPLNYRSSEWLWLEGNTNQFSPMPLMSGGGFWQEVVPQHGLRGSFESSTVSFANSVAQGTYNRAYRKFRDGANTKASSLTAIAERQQTIDMIVSRLQQLYKGAKALRNGRFREFLTTFGIRAKKKHSDTRWTRPKQFGSLWLEYWMGWAPTVGDIYNALDFLGSPIPDQPVKASARSPYTGYVKSSSGGTVAISQWEGSYRVGISAHISVTNPTLYKLNGLGLLNPLQTLWETTPFSWFADWFTNVGQVLGQLTDWVGLQLKDLVITVKTVATCSWVCTGARLIYGPGPDVYWRKRDYKEFSRNTVSTLPWVKPVFRLPNGLSLTRGATLASLLVTIFSR